MDSENKVPYGKVSTVEELGMLIRHHRKRQQVRINDVSEISMLGERFIGECERGKATCQIGKIFQLLACLGLEIRVVPRGSK
jgi:HTH-type transcriptional regulator / antitoxin HipB